MAKNTRDIKLVAEVRYTKLLFQENNFSKRPGSY
jgi:hypothetical protein